MFSRHIVPKRFDSFDFWVINFYANHEVTFYVIFVYQLIEKIIVYVYTQHIKKSVRSTIWQFLMIIPQVYTQTDITTIT